MEFQGTMDFPLMELGISQLYLNQDKIQTIEKWFSSGDMNIFQPLAVHDYGNGRYTIVDGHSRAFVAYKNGIKTVPIIYDRSELVAGEVALQLYNADIEWCNRFHIEKISDLEKRIITKEERRLIQEKVPGLYLYGAEEDLSAFYFEDASGKLYAYRDTVLSLED